jgi:hypothetical protein
MITQSKPELIFETSATTCLGSLELNPEDEGTAMLRNISNYLHKQSWTFNSEDEGTTILRNISNYLHCDASKHQQLLA